MVQHQTSGNVIGSGGGGGGGGEDFIIFTCKLPQTNRTPWQLKVEYELQTYPYTVLSFGISAKQKLHFDLHKRITSSLRLGSSSRSINYFGDSSVLRRLISIILSWQVAHNKALVFILHFSASHSDRIKCATLEMA